MCCCCNRHNSINSRTCKRFWNKERKINALLDELKSLEERSEHLERLIEELKEEK